LTLSALAHALAAGPPPVEANTALSDFGLSIAATAVGAVQGALKAVDGRGYDVVGVVVIAGCLGFGGGIVRDMLTGTIPPDALRTPWFTVTVFIAAFLTMFLHHWFRKLGRLLFLADALVMGLFGAVGAEKALLVGLSPFIAVVLGTVVAVSGGIIADLFMGHRPAILLPGKPYALAGLVGVLVYVLLANKFKVHTNLATAADVLVVVAIRIVVDWKGITTPTPAEITPGLIERMESRDGDDLDGRGTA